MFSRGDNIYLIARRSIFPEDRDEGYGDFKEYRAGYFASFPFETTNATTDDLWGSYDGEAPTGFPTLLDLFHPGPWTQTETANILYWILPKRTSLYRLDTAKLQSFINADNLKPCDYTLMVKRSSKIFSSLKNMEILPAQSYACEQSLPVKLITDFVGTNGDSAYPALIQQTRDQYLFLNYTSQFWDYTEKHWVGGQISPTFLLATNLRFENSGS
jgi:hypothetical protein